MRSAPTPGTAAKASGADADAGLGWGVDYVRVVVDPGHLRYEGVSCTRSQVLARPLAPAVAKALRGRVPFVLRRPRHAA